MYPAVIVTIDFWSSFLNTHIEWSYDYVRRTDEDAKQFLEWKNNHIECTLLWQKANKPSAMHIDCDPECDVIACTMHWRNMNGFTSGTAPFLMEEQLIVICADHSCSFEGVCRPTSQGDIPVFLKRSNKPWAHISRGDFAQNVKARTKIAGSVLCNTFPDSHVHRQLPQNSFR